MSSQLAIPQQLDTLPISTGATAAALGASSGKTSGDTLSEFAQLIQSLSPQPINQGAAPKSGGTTLPEPTAKNATLVADPRGTKGAELGSTRLVAAYPSQSQATISPSSPVPVVGQQTPQPTESNLVQAALIPDAALPETSSGQASVGTKRDVSTQNSADVSSADETNTPLPPQQQESTGSAMPAESQPMRKTTPAKSNDNPTPPAIAIATPTLLLPPVALRMTMSNSLSGSPPSQQPIAAPQQESSSTSTLAAAPALEVRIRATEEPKENSAQPQTAAELVAMPVTPPVNQAPLQPEAVQPVPVSARIVSSQIQSEAQPQVPPQANPVSAVTQPQSAAFATPAAARTGRPASQPAQYYEAAAEPPSPSRSQGQPLRSVSLEFTPDGASDVRLRLSERAGDVHIELHSTDPALTGRLSENVHDLATSLVNAGYDAQAWTPGQDREGGRGQQQENPSGKQRDQAADPNAEDFDTAMQEPMKEFS